MAGRKQIAFCATAILFASLGSPRARADQWLLSGAISERLLFDSNIRLSNTDKKSVFGSITSFNGDLAWNSPRATINASGSVGISRYTNDSSLSSESFGLNVQSLYRLPRGAIGLGASIQRASTLTTERADSGNFSDVANQLSIAIFPSWQYELSPIETISLNGSYARQVFDSATFADSASYAASASWRRQLSPSESVSIGASFAYIETNGGSTVTRSAITQGASDSRSQSYGLFVGWTKSLTPNLGFSITVGPRLAITQTNNSRADDSENVSVGANVDLSLSYALSERTALVVSAGQGIEPSSTGQIQERQRVSLSLQHQFRSRLGMTFVGSFQHDGRTFAGGSSTTEDNGRISFAVMGNFSYQLSPTLSAGVQYNFRAQNRSSTQGIESGSGFAHSHAAAVVLTYSPRAWILGH